MQEAVRNPEDTPPISREQVVAAFRHFSEAGVKLPHDIDDDDPKGKFAYKLLNDWRSQEEVLIAGNNELLVRHSLETSMIFVDAGFTDPNFLRRMLYREVAVDLTDSGEKVPDDPERVETRRQLRAAIKKIRKLIQNQ